MVLHTFGMLQIRQILKKLIAFRLMQEQLMMLKYHQMVKLLLLVERVLQTEKMEL